MQTRPPFDDSPACPCCSAKIRNLYAVAYNFVSGARDVSIGDLEEACEAVRPLIEAHFASKMHSHGMVEDDEKLSPTRKDEPSK